MQELTPYQREALARFSHQKACALFMEMGTGKTRTAVELANYHAARYDAVLWLTIGKSAMCGAIFLITALNTAVFMI